VDGSFEEYVAARGDALLRFAYVLTGRRHLAEDLVQEVLARIHPRWRRMTHVEQPDAYLRTAIVRQFLSWRRRLASRESSLVLRFYEDLSDDRIAEVLGCQATTVRVHASRGLARLREALQPRLPQQVTVTNAGGDS
jgi:DNA-directed RNA polymerase specialized sigma24 family protein